MIRTLVALLALVFALGAPVAGAQTQKWDQKAVTDIAVNLEKSISGLRDQVQRSSQLQLPSSKRVYIYEILDNLRQMEFMSGSLKARLIGGEGLEETTPTYNKLQLIRRDTEVIAQKVDITDITRPKLDAAREQLAKMEPYYPPQPSIQDIR